MLIVGILKGPDGQVFGTTNKAEGHVCVTTSCSTCLASLLYMVEFEEPVLIRIFPWSKREAFEDLVPDSMSKAIMSEIERRHHVHPDNG